MRWYITQKNESTADVTEAKVDRSQGMFGTTPLPDVFVKMQYNGRDFTVYITGKEESKDGCDTYQAPEIRQALFDMTDTVIKISHVPAEPTWQKVLLGISLCCVFLAANTDFVNCEVKHDLNRLH